MAKRYIKTEKHSSFSSPKKAAKLENVLSLVTVISSLLRFRSRACVVVLAGIAALVCAAGIASANTNADAKTRVWDFDSAAPLHTWLDADASPRLHLENQSGSGEPASASPHAARGLGALSQAGKYGIQPYNQLTKALKGTGLQAHHLVEQRFAGVLGQNARQMASVAVTKAEHQAFTNAWRQAIPYGQGTANATRQQVLDAARQIYADHPAILSALGL